MKKLEDMTLEELWRLFPVVLAQHCPQWEEWAAAEIAVLRRLLNSFSPVINHIGSTAIPSIQAKPTVDILVEIPQSVPWRHVKEVMLSAGYLCMSETDSRLSFNKGYTPSGYAERVFHIHFHRTGDADEILFRDYLIENPELAAEYERLKLSLLPAYRHDRDGYTRAKTEFVKRIVRLAKGCRDDENL